MLDDWETQQEARKKEEALKEKARERKEFTKDLARIIQPKRKDRKHVNTSSESSTSVDSTPRTTPDSSPELKHAKHKKKKRHKKTKEMSHSPIESNEIAKSLIDLRSTNDKIHREILELKRAHADTTATVERMEFEMNTMIASKEKIESRIRKLETQQPKKNLVIKSPPTKEHHNLASDDSETELKDKKLLKDDKVFDLALKFGIATCLKKSDLEKKFEKKPGTTKLKEFCTEVDIQYITKNKAMGDVWQLLLDNHIVR